jgi:hypothetical protein
MAADSDWNVREWVTHLQTRIQRLADRAGGDRCPACGHGPGVPVRFTLDTTRRDEGASTDPEHCPKCGRVTRFTIAFDRADRLDRGGTQGDREDQARL